MGSAFTEKREKNEKEESVLSMKKPCGWAGSLPLGETGGQRPGAFLESCVFLLLVLTIQAKSYHRLTRANTPASAPLRRFLPFSPWRAPAHLRLKSQKSLGNPSLAGAKQFCRAEMCPDKERPAGNTCRISKGLDAVWAYFCPSKPCLPLSTDGKEI